VLWQLVFPKIPKRRSSAALQKRFALRILFATLLTTSAMKVPAMLTLTVQTTPNAPRSEVMGWSGDRLRVKVKAPAVEGKANAELIRFLAECFEVRPGAVTILRGETARLKVVRIDGVDEITCHRRFPQPS